MTIRQRVEVLARCGGVSVEEGSSDPVPEVLERVRPPRQFPAKYKAEILAGYERAGSARAPRSRCLRHSEISDVYKPSRRNSAPLPSLSSRSYSARISALYFARN